MKVRVVEIRKAETPKNLEMIIFRSFMKEHSKRYEVLYGDRKENV